MTRNRVAPIDPRETSSRPTSLAVPDLVRLDAEVLPKRAAPHLRRWRSRGALLLERLTDLIDRVVALAQRNDLLVCGALLGLVGGARYPRGEEFRKFVAAEGMTEHAERAWRIAEALGDLEGGSPSR